MAIPDLKEKHTDDLSNMTDQELLDRIKKFPAGSKESSRAVNELVKRANRTTRLTSRKTRTAKQRANRHIVITYGAGSRARVLRLQRVYSTATRWLQSSTTDRQTRQT